MWADVNIKLFNKIVELFPEKKADRVYHYTSMEVLWEFLKPEYDFLCTYCKALSDPTEFKTGMFACTRMMRKLSNGNEEDFLQPLRGAVELSGKSGLECMPWTMSFSNADDDTNQWKNYTDRNKGGCAVGFNVEKIKLAIGAGLAHDRWCLINFLPCVYVGCDSDDLVYELFEYAMNDLARDLACKLSQSHNDRLADKAARTLVFLLLSSIFKHQDFKDEREWRLVLQPLNLSEVAKAVVMKGGKIRMRTGVWGEKRKVSDCIERIVVSPHGPSDNLKEMGDLFAALRGLQKGDMPIVVPSESPYRGI